MLPWSSLKHQETKKKKALRVDIEQTTTLNLAERVWRVQEKKANFMMTLGFNSNSLESKPVEILYLQPQM